MNQQHPIQEQIKKLLDDHGVQILSAHDMKSEGLALRIQDVVSGQRATLMIPFGKKI